MPSYGPKYAGTAVDTGGGSTGGSGWTNPSYAVGAPDGGYSSATCPLGTQTTDFALTKFGFSVPAGATITGLSVEVYGHAGSTWLYLTFAVIVDGSYQYTTNGVNYLLLPTSDAWTPGIYNGSLNTWDGGAPLSLSPSQVNASDFGLRMVAGLNSGGPSSDTAYVDSVRLTVSYDDATSTAPAFTSADSARFTAGTGGTFTVTTSGSPDATISETDTPPTGVSLSDNGDGTATLTVDSSAAAGTYTLTFFATNGVSPDASQTFTLTINAAPTATIVPWHLFNGMQ